MTIIPCTLERHGEAVRAIFNEAIANSTALYDYKPRSREAIEEWFRAKERAGWPVVGVEDEEGVLMGFASFGPFRPHPAYKYSAEHSVYVDARFRRRGIGRALLEKIIELARRHDLHVLIGAIDAANAGSIALHEQLGFVRAGTIRQAGFKFGRWLDLAFYQLTLSTPARPADG